MTAVDTTGIRRTAARAALSVRTVAELQPSLGQSLAGAATRVRRALGAPAPPPEAGIRAERSAHTGTWHLEVRCALNGDRRALDTARDVHDAVRAAVEAHLTRNATPGPVTVIVTVTRITGPLPAAAHMPE